MRPRGFRLSASTCTCARSRRKGHSRPGKHVAKYRASFRSQCAGRKHVRHAYIYICPESTALYGARAMHKQRPQCTCLAWEGSSWRGLMASPQALHCHARRCAQRVAQARSMCGCTTPHTVLRKPYAESTCAMAWGAPTGARHVRVRGGRADMDGTEKHPAQSSLVLWRFRVLGFFDLGT